MGGFAVEALEEDVQEQGFEVGADVLIVGVFFKFSVDPEFDGVG